MKKVIGVITARMGSTRLPGKVFKKFSGKTVFEHHVERMTRVQGIDGVFLATSKDPKNCVLIEEAKRLGCGYFAGSEEDIVERHIRLCENESADAVIRVTCDSPIFDIDMSSKFAESFKQEYYDYIVCGNMTMIQGTLSELISYDALKKVHLSYRGPAISQPIKENPLAYKIKTLDMDADLIRPEYRLTLDEKEDYILIEHIYNALYRESPLDLHGVYSWLDDNPEIARINQHVTIKGVEQYSANLLEKPLFSIVKSGRKYVILNENKQMVEPAVFLDTFKTLFDIAESS